MSAAIFPQGLRDESDVAVGPDGTQYGNYRLLCSDARYRVKHKQRDGQWLRLCKTCLDYMPFSKFYQKGSRKDGVRYFFSECKGCVARRRRRVVDQRAMKAKYEKLVDQYQEGFPVDVDEIHALRRALGPAAEE